MTTVAEVRQVVKPIIERNPDLRMVGPLIVVKPVRHLLRGIYIGRSLDPTIFVPSWFVTFSFEPDAVLSFAWVIASTTARTAHGSSLTRQRLR